MSQSVIRWLTEKNGVHVIEFIESLQKELQEHKQDAANAKQDRDDALKVAHKYQGEMRGLREQVAEQKEEIESLVAKTKGSNGYQAKLQDEIASLEKKADKLQGKVNEMQSILDKAENQNEGLESLLQQANAKIDGLQSRLNAIVDFVNRK